MANFHFVEDYERLVANLVASHPLDEAMSLAVGGLYDVFGPIEAQLLADVGLKNGMRLIDLGCGSGRGAVAISKRFDIAYLGTDIVQALLDYAASKTPAHYQFKLHRKLSIPAADASADIVCAFSLFTHLLHAETYLYLEEAVRVLKPNGIVVFSYLDFVEHWVVFQDTVNAQRSNTLPHLNMFIDRSAIEQWSAHLGLLVDEYISSGKPIFQGQAFGQSVVVLRKPAAKPGQSPAGDDGHRAALTMFSQGQEGQALDQLIKLANAGSTNWEVYNDIGVIYFRAGELERSAQYLRSAVALDSQSNTSLDNLAAVLTKLGDIAGAISACERMLARAPEDREVRKQLDDLRHTSKKGG
jgi:SAM-dependent methyltransferase